MQELSADLDGWLVKVAGDENGNACGLIMRGSNVIGSVSYNANGEPFRDYDLHPVLLVQYDDVPCAWASNVAEARSIIKARHLEGEK